MSESIILDAFLNKLVMPLFLLLCVLAIWKGSCTGFKLGNRAFGWFVVFFAIGQLIPRFFVETGILGLVPSALGLLFSILSLGILLGYLPHWLWEEFG